MVLIGVLGVLLISSIVVGTVQVMHLKKGNEYKLLIKIDLKIKIHRSDTHMYHATLKKTL